MEVGEEGPREELHCKLLLPSAKYHHYMVTDRPVNQTGSVNETFEADFFTLSNHG